MEERPIFVDTNIDTHMAVSVSADITVADLKHKLEKEHFSCFPELGRFKVKRKFVFYYLPDTMHVKHVFPIFCRLWFLFMDLTSPEDHHNLSPIQCMQSCQQCLCEEIMPVHVSSGFILEGKITSGCRDWRTKCTASKGNKGTLEKFISTSDHLNSCGMRKPDFEERENLDENLILEYGNLDKHVLSEFNNAGLGFILDVNACATDDVGSGGKSMTTSKSSKNGSPSSTHTTGGNISQCMSISAIISHYFCDFDEVVSSSNIPTDISTQIKDSTHPMTESLDSSIRDNSNESMLLSKINIPDRNMVSRSMSSGREHLVHQHLTGQENSTGYHFLAVKRTKTRKGSKKQTIRDNENIERVQESICIAHPCIGRSKPASNTSSHGLNGRVHVKDVGRCIIRAANNISSPPTFAGSKNLAPDDAYSLARSSVFEINDNDD